MTMKSHQCCHKLLLLVFNLFLVHHPNPQLYTKYITLVLRVDQINELFAESPKRDESLEFDYLLSSKIVINFYLISDVLYINHFLKC